MVLQMVVDERLDEVVAVVVPRVAAQREGLANLRACCLEQMGVQLPFQKLVRHALVRGWFSISTVASCSPQLVRSAPR